MAADGSGGIRRLLVANRGEIAVRVMRAATELGITTIGVYTEADRRSIHRVKSDESYVVGDPARPLAGYLDADALVELAVRVGADALHPGYGFLSESPRLARACAEAGVVFVGPPAEVLEAAGDKVTARGHAAAAGLPVLAATGALDPAADPHAAAEALGYPLFVKAAAGGGGRGLRLVRSPAQLLDAVASARAEAEGGFGDATVFLEQAVLRPRHLEVQVLADASGDVIHLFERDCSVQRRHQKVLEIAPAPGLDPEIRTRLCADAVAFARRVGYVNAGTVEFLLGGDGRHHFIEMNPRIQVEHTITEEVCDVDLVQAQLRIAGGATLTDLGLTQDAIATRGTAIQCRITTEDPSNGFRPGTGRITAYRSTGGHGVRLDAGTMDVGTEVSPYFDSLLAKLTSRGPDLPSAARRARRALAEFRVRGVPTNLAFLQALLADPDQLVRELSTAYLDEHPELLAAAGGRDRVSRLLEHVGDVTVNRPHGPPPGRPDPRELLPPLPAGAPPDGTRQRLLADGPEAFAVWMRTSERLLVTDTTLRDAHQSLLATRMRTHDMLGAAPHLAHRLPELLSLEAWGGATYDAALRFLHEDPWERLARLREAVPNVCLQMLLRGRNALGYRSYPAVVVRSFVREAADVGVDVFRIFDALNDVERMRPAIEAVREVGRLAEGTLCYSGDLADPREDVYTLDHYLRTAEGLVAAGAHVLCIKDMAGVLRPPAAATLVSALRDRFDLPVHLHTHDTLGGQTATYLAALGAGVDAVDGAASPLAGTTSQPPLPAVVAMVAGTPADTGLDLDALLDLEPYWQAVRDAYAPFDEALRAPTGLVLRHAMPGGQITNLMQQAAALGVEGGFDALADRYVQADRLLGRLIKVTPTSKVVGDLAIWLAINDVTPEALVAEPGRYALPASVLDLLAGDLGTPPGGWPEPLRSRVLAAHDVRLEDPVLAAEDEAVLARPGAEARRRLSELMLPGPAREHAAARERYGDLSVLPTELFWHGLTADREVHVELEPGVEVGLALEAVGEADESGHRSLHLRVNGLPRTVEVLDRTSGAVPEERVLADPADPGHLAAQMTGVVTLGVAEGDAVTAGTTVGSIEAMKMESPLRAPTDGRVARVVVGSGTRVEAGDLLLVVEALDGAA
jgi:pyruvate carboxylase